MKPFGHFALTRSLTSITCVLTLSAGIARAADRFWDGTVNPGNWADLANWSDVATATTPNTTVPGASDVAVFTINGITTAQTVNLNGVITTVGGIRTASQTGATTIAYGTAPSTLVIGTSGINHVAGGFNIGSTTAGQEVNVNLAGSQTWISSAAGGGAAAINARNPITNSSGAPITFTLSGINTGSILSGGITNGTGAITVVKTGTGLWSLDGTNTYTGPTQINQGTIRAVRAVSLDPASTAISVASDATLSLRLGGTTGYTVAQLDNMRNVVNWSVDSILGLDTANANVTYAGNFEFLTNYRLNKLGGNTLTLAGNVSNYGKIFTITEGALAITTPLSLPPFITLAAGGNLVLYAGGTGFSIDQMLAIRQSVDSSTGIFSIATDNGDFVFNQPIDTESLMRIAKTGPNTLFLTQNSVYPGGTSISAGTLALQTLPNGGVTGPIGQSSNAATNLAISGRLRYLGAAAETDRLFQINGNGAIEASGTGRLLFSNPGISGTGTAAVRNFTLTGYNTGDNRINNIITNTGTAANITGILKVGHGHWALAGANTFTGTTRVRGGSFTLDYTTADPISTGPLVAQTGTLLFQAASGGSSDTIFSFALGEAQNGFTYVKLSGGMNLTATTFDGSANSQRHHLIDLQGAGNSLTVGSLNTTTNNLRAGADGLLNNNSATATNGRANLVVRANDGSYGFAAFAAGSSSGALQKLTLPAPTPGGTSDLPVDLPVNSATTNYGVGSGFFSVTGAANFSTLTIDSTNGPAGISFGGSISPGGTGKAILVSGANDVTFSGAGGNFSQPVWIHNYISPAATFNLSSSVGGAAFFIMGGTGFTNYTGIGLGTTTATTNFILNGGVFRAATDQTLPAAGLYRVTDAIFEVGADLNGADPGDFSIATNTSIQLFDSAGFSAYTPTPGGTRLVNLGATGLTWGTNYFLVNTVGPTTADSDGDYAFRLSSTRSNATIKFENAINLNGKYRTIEVANGTADVDAELSGVLSGTGVASGITKTGTGTLRLSGANTYTGATRVNEGTLVISSGVLANASRVEITGSGMLNISSGTAFVSAVTINGVAQPAGPVTNPAVTGNLVVGDTVQTPYDLWVVQKALAAGQSAPLFDADGDGLLNLIEYAVGSEPKVPNGSVVTRNAGLPSVVKFNRAAGRTDINVFLEASTTLGNDWTTIATSTAGTAYVGSANVTVAEAAGAVTVTDNRPGLGTKVFYRLRAVK